MKILWGRTFGETTVFEEHEFSDIEIVPDEIKKIVKEEADRDVRAIKILRFIRDKLSIDKLNKKQQHLRNEVEQ